MGRGGSRPSGEREFTGLASPSPAPGPRPAADRRPTPHRWSPPRSSTSGILPSAIRTAGATSVRTRRRRRRSRPPMRFRTAFARSGRCRPAPPSRRAGKKRSFRHQHRRTRRRIPRRRRRRRSRSRNRSRSRETPRSPTTVPILGERARP